MHITCSINYWSDEVATFDPEKVAGKLRAAFPEADVDPTDQAAAEVENLRRRIEPFFDTNPSLKTMLRQMQGKARRNGPVFAFKMPGIRGTVGRYSVVFMSEVDVEGSLRERIVAFLESLRLGSVKVSATR